MNRHIILKNSFWIGVDRLFSFVATFISSVAVARVIGPTELGYYSYVLWIASITTALTSFGIPVATRKYVAEYIGKGELAIAHQYVRTSLRLQWAAACALLGGGLVVVLLAVPVPYRLFASLAVMSYIPSMVLSIYGSALAGAEDYRSNVTGSLVSTVVNLVGVGLSLWFRWDLVGLAGALLASRTVDLVLRVWFFRCRFPRLGPQEKLTRGLPPSLRKRMMAFCLQSSLLLLINVVVWDRSEIFFLKQFSSIREVAYYSLAFNIAQQLTLIPQIVANAAGATMMVQYGRAPDSVGKLTSNVMRYIALISLPLMMTVGALSSPLLHVLYGPKYVSAIPALVVSSLFMIGRASLPPVQQLLMAIEKQSVLVKWGFACAVVNILLDLLLIRHGGATGAAWANGLAQAIAALGAWILACRAYPVVLPWTLFGKVLLCSSIAGLGAGVTAFVLPPSVALIGGGTIAGMCLTASLRFTRALEPPDVERLLSVGAKLPRQIQTPYNWLLSLVSSRNVTVCV